MNQHLRPTLRNRLAAALTGLGLFLAVVSTGQANPNYVFTLDTSAYAGTSGYLAFDLIDGDATTDNFVAVSNLNVTGGSLTDSSNFGIADVDFFNEVLRDVVLGTSLSFSFELSENFAGGSPDSFSFYVLDSGFFSVFATIDPLGTDAIFQVDVTGTPGGNVSVYAGSLRVPDQGSTLALGGLAFGLLVFARRFGARRVAA